jgi:hypothetical protein
MTEQTSLSHPNISLAAVRRFYFYFVALVSLVAGLFAIDGLLMVLSDIWLGSTGLLAAGVGDYWRNAVARNGGILLVALPIFLLHWGYIQRRLTEEAERRAALRKLYLYGAAGVAIGFAAVRGYDLLAGAGFLAFGGAPQRSAILPGDWLHLALMSATALALNAYWQHILRADGDYGRETTRAGTVRRLFQTILGLIGLALVIVGSAQMLEVVWKLLVGRSALTVEFGWWQHQLSSGLAQLLVGALMLHLNQQRWQTIIDANPAEAATALRRFYLYASVVISALAVLAPGAMLLREGLLILFGTGGGALNELLERMGRPISFVPAGLVGWLWYRRELHGEARRYGESPEAVTIRRIYYYAVAATALALLWLGLVEILSALLDALLNRSALMSTEPIWAQPLATGLALVAVSAPVWSYHWRAVQRVARQPDAAGHNERTSAPRRIYLYGVALVGAVLILVNTAQVLYRLLLLLLGEPGIDFFTTQTANELARGIIAAALWIVHILAIRADGQLEADYEANLPAAAPAAVDDERRALERHIAALETQLAKARSRLATLEAEDRD